MKRVSELIIIINIYNGIYNEIKKIIIPKIYKHDSSVFTFIYSSTT